jgi:hypothetical protein
MNDRNSRGGRARLRITGGLVRRRVGESHPDARQQATKSKTFSVIRFADARVRDRPRWQC